MVVPATLQCRVSHVLVIDDHTVTDFLLVQRYITECIRTRRPWSSCHLTCPANDSRPVVYMFCFCFLFLCLFFNDSCLSDYLKIYCRILKAGRTLAVGDRSEISFSIPRWTLPWQPIFVGFIHGTDCCHASG